MNWIKERLNRDNFWNLIFGCGMISGMSIAGLLVEHIYASSAAFWITLLLIPYLIKNCSKVALSADNIMLNCNGESLKGKYPNNLFFLIAFTLGLPVLAGLIMDGHFRDISPIISGFIMIFLFFMTPTLYFIYKNCPIAILFNRKAWYPEVLGVDPNRVKKLDSGYEDSRRHSMTYSHLPGNVFYTSRHNRR